MDGDESTASGAYGVRKLDYAPVPINIHVTNPLEATYRLHACAKEPWTIEFIEALPQGSWFFDIGANVGPYTLVAAARGLHVVAIEPSFESYGALCRNLLMNNFLDRAIPLAMAVTDKTGFTWLAYNDVRAGANGNDLGPQVEASFQHHRQCVPIMRLDDLMRLLPIPLDAPIAMKIDVDGGEPGVLQGADNLLRSGRVGQMMIEIQRAQEADVVAWLEERGWTLEQRYTERPAVPDAHIAAGEIGSVVYGRFTHATRVRPELVGV